MARVRKVKAVEKINLEEDGIFSAAIQALAHESPEPIHIRRAAEALAVEEHEVPVVGTIADLIVYVLSVKAAGGNEAAMKEFLDRFAPKAARVGAIDLNIGSQAGPVASANADEQAAATDYVNALRLVKK